MIVGRVFACQYRLDIVVRRYVERVGTWAD